MCGKVWQNKALGATLSATLNFTIVEVELRSGVWPFMISKRATATN